MSFFSEGYFHFHPPANASTPNAPTPTHNVGSPQTPKSPRTPKSPKAKAPAKPRQQKSRLYSVYKHPSTPTTEPAQIPAPTNGVKRPREEDGPSPPNVGRSSSTPAAPGPSGTTNEPLPPKRVKTDREGPISDELQKKTEAGESIEIEEDASSFLEQMLSLVSNGEDGSASGLLVEFGQTLDAIFEGVGTVPDSEGSGDVSSILSGDIIRRSSPSPVEFYDFSSFGAAQEGNEYTSKADFSPSLPINPSPESDHESDPTLHISNNMVLDDDPSDPLRLGTLKDIDGGESTYYQSNELEREPPVSTLEAHWIFGPSSEGAAEGNFNMPRSPLLNNGAGPSRMATNFEDSNSPWNEEPSEPKWNWDVPPLRSTLEPPWIFGPSSEGAAEGNFNMPRSPLLNNGAGPSRMATNFEDSNSPWNEEPSEPKWNWDVPPLRSTLEPPWIFGPSSEGAAEGKLQQTPSDGNGSTPGDTLLSNGAGLSPMANDFEDFNHRWNEEPSGPNEPGDGSTSTATGNTMFSDNSQVTVNNGQFNNVSGDQNNNVAHSHSSSYTFIAPQAFQMLQTSEPIPAPIPQILPDIDESALSRVLNQVSRWSYERISSIDADTLKIFVLLACFHFGPQLVQGVAGYLSSRDVLTLAG
ncbi:hypothetical protein VNI00_005165 [Paramarasmius palmivorus]|uniref:Uncharacterized protein n=1 Tax=Paramarasmius palmivorus TaxID=297713 RepID=A0AAW0DEL5_9AGAR